MTKRVVDLPEVGEVEQHQGKTGVRVHVGDDLLDLGHERPPVGQIREEVVQRLVLPLLHFGAQPLHEPRILERDGEVVGERLERRHVLLAEGR